MDNEKKGYWIGNLLIHAKNYADALRCSDLVDDGETLNDAERESGAEIITVLRGAK